MAHDHIDHNSPEYLRKQSRTVWAVGGVLLAGTLITVAVMYLDLGSRSANIALGMFIAIIKASFVALIFMHLKDERGLVYKILFFTILFAIGLFVLSYLGYADPLWSHVIPVK